MTRGTVRSSAVTGGTSATLPRDAVTPPATASVAGTGTAPPSALTLADEFTDEIGRTYYALGELGRGVLTTVRAAEPSAAHPQALRGPLAIKTILPLWIGHPLAEARIARERELSDAIHGPVSAAAQAAPSESPGLPCARILAGGRQACEGNRSRPFHVTTRLSGMTLADRLRPSDELVSAGLAIGWAFDLMDSLARIHEVGWVHRDVKPQNIFVVPAPPAGRGSSTSDLDVQRARAWLIDFGLALPIGAPRDGGDEPFGTPAYVSPEVIAGAPVDPRADIYSLGLIMFELFAGRRAFTIRDPIALLDAHLSATAPLLRSVQPACSTDLERVIAATLGKDPGERPATVGELRRMLAAAPEAQQMNVSSSQTGIR